MRNDELGTVIVHTELLSDHHIDTPRRGARDRGREDRHARGVGVAPRRTGAEGGGGFRIARHRRPGFRALRWIQTIGAGMDWLLRAPEVVQSDILVTNASGVAAVPIAEHILALMFVLTRRMHRFAQAQREHEWFQRGRCEEIDGTTMGIIGLGPMKTAEKAQGLNMRVLGLRRDPSRTSRRPHVRPGRTA